MKRIAAPILLALLAGPPAVAGVYDGPTDDATFTQLLADVDAKIAELDQKVIDAENAGVTTAYAQVSQVTIDLFRNSFAPWDRANPAAVQAMYDAKHLGQFDPVGPIGLPFDELADAIEVADAAIAELDAQIAGTLELRDPPDFATGMPAALNGTHYQKDGQTVFPTRFFWQPEDEEIMQAFGRMGEGYYSVQFMDSPTNVISWRVSDFAASMQHQADINRTPAQFFLGHVVPNNHYFRTNFPEAFASGSRLFTHYDIDNPDVRDWLTVLTQDMMAPGATTLAGHERVHMMSNEPVFAIRAGGVHADRGVSAHTMDKYSAWLQNKYGDIATLNATYGTAHADFNAVKAAYPIPLALSYQGGPVWYDWNVFNYDRVNEWFTFLHDQHKTVDPGGRTHLKLMGERSLHARYNDEGLDFEYISKLIDVPGSDAQMTSLRAEFDSRHNQDWRDRWVLEWRAQSITLDFMKSIAPNKPMFDSEWHGFSGSRWRDYHMSPEYVRAALWMAFTEGVSAMNVWVWNRRDDGSIDTRADFVGTSVTQPIQLDAFGRTMKELNAHGDVFGRLVPAERNFLVYYSKDSAIQDPDYTTELSDVYEALKILNIPVGFTTPSELANVSTANQAVIVPPTPFISDADFAALKDFIANGGYVAVVGAADNFGRTELGAARTDTTLGAATIGFGGVLGMADDFVTEFAARIPDLPLAVNVTASTGADAYGVLAKQYTDGDRYVVALINLSQDDRNVALEVPQGTPNDVLDLITGQGGSASFSMAPMDVLLLSVGQAVDAPPPPPPPPPPSGGGGGGGSFGLLTLLSLMLLGIRRRITSK